MGEIITFGDIEYALVIHLTDTLDDVPVSATVPKVRPATFVTVRRLGGPKRNMVVDSPLVTFECWADTGGNAYSLASLVRGIINALPGEVIEGINIYRVEEASGPAMLPDPDSNQMRYVFTASIDARAI
jgi:hypothetical protein